MAGQIGGGGCDGKAETGDDSARNGGFGDAEGEIAGVGGDAKGEFGAGFDDEGERAGPELLGESIEGGVELAGEFVGLGDLGDEQRERLVAGAGFDLVDAVDGAQIDGVDGEAVKGVGRERDDVAAIKARDDVVDERWFGFVGVDTESFGRQVLLLFRVWVSGAAGCTPPPVCCAKSSIDET